MNIIIEEINKLIPYHNNPRKNQAVDKVASSIKEFAKQPAFWLSAKKYLDVVPKKEYNFGITITKDEDRVKMFTDAIKNNKVTRFIKDYAAKNKDVIDMGIRKGFLTKEEAINDLGMKNEYK